MWKLYRQNPVSMPWREGGFKYQGAYIRQEKQFNLQSVKLAFLSFFSSMKIPVSRCECTRIRNINGKVKNKYTVEVILAYLLLTSNTFHFLLHYFYCWLWWVNWRLGLLFVVLTLCACYNYSKQGFHLWKN